MRTKSMKGRRPIRRHGATILTVVAVFGVFLTGYLSAKAAPEANEKLEEAKEAKAMAKAKETGEEADVESVELTFVEKVKTAGPVYWKAVASGAVTIGCVVASRVTSAREVASLTTTLGTTTAFASKYMKKAKDVMGEEKEKEIRAEAHKEVAEDKAKAKKQNQKRLLPGNSAPTRAIMTGDGDERFYDPWNDRYFYSSLTALREHMNELNNDIVHGDYDCCCSADDDGTIRVPLNEYYERANLASTKSGERLGFVLASPAYNPRNSYARDLVELDIHQGSVEYAGQLWSIIDFRTEVEALDI